MSKVTNILFIMCDQLRWDYLSCYGHPHLKTPHIDKLAAKGLRFKNAFCQAPLCGPSRASYYTGRYMSSHGALANADPLKLGELTLGDYLRAQGMDTFLIGKTDTDSSEVGQDLIGLDENSLFRKRAKSGGFDVFERYEGLYPSAILPDRLGYNAYLKSQNYEGDNPWDSFANSAIDDNGDLVSGWYLRNSHLASRVAEKDSETAFLTNRAIDFLTSREENQPPWCLHLSYFKPHWPLMAPAPYHNMYSKEQVIKPIRSDAERQNNHPVYQAFSQLEYSKNYSLDSVREHVIPTYMGFIKQIDDHLGRLFATMNELDLFENTMVVLTSDHGDYLGDHWLGEKDLFHDCSVKVPLIIYDPRSEANPTRGLETSLLAGAIDIIPTFVESIGGKICRERLEGESLQSILHDTKSEWRDFIVSEIDYSDRGARGILNQAPYACRAYMLRSEQWKYIYYEGFRPQLFDLVNDPDELIDLALDDNHKDKLDGFEKKLFEWFRFKKIRTEMPYQNLADMGPEKDEEIGIIIGRW